jgi:predicted DCC family thiol-disulfide oxidoreductase YuxK
MVVSRNSSSRTDPNERFARTYMVNKQKLFYDGACPLCNAEVNQLKKCADKNLQFIDVHGIQTAGADIEPLLRVLHYENADGNVLTGLDANVAAWQHTRWGVFWRWLRWPVIRTIADLIYLTWADIRFKRLYPDGVNNRPDNRL